MSAFSETLSSSVWKPENMEAHSWYIQLNCILLSYLGSPICSYGVVENLKSSVKFVNFLCTPSMEYIALFLPLWHLDKCIYFFTWFYSLVFIFPFLTLIFNFTFLYFSLHDFSIRRLSFQLLFDAPIPDMSFLWNLSSAKFEVE